LYSTGWELLEKGQSQNQVVAGVMIFGELGLSKNYWRNYPGKRSSTSVKIPSYEPSLKARLLSL